MKTKTTLCPTLGYDSKGTEKVLREMSRQGWILKKAGILWKYEEAEPKERAFSVVYTRPGDWMEEGESEELRNIAEHAESIGWQRINSRNDRNNNNTSIFMNEDPAAEPLETDESVHLMNTRETMGRTVKGWMISRIVVSMTPFLNYFGYPDYDGIVKPKWALYIGVFDILLGLAVLAGYLLWLRRAQKALDMGREIPDMLKYTKFFRGLTILIAALWVTVYMRVEGGPLALLIVSAGVLGLTIAGMLLMKATDSESKSKRIVFTAAALIIAVAAVFMLLYFVTK